MDLDGQQWFEALRTHTTALRARTPLPPRPTLTPVSEQQCRIIGGALIPWLERYGPDLISQRGIYTRTRQLASSPYVLIITDTAGLVAATEIIGVGHPRVEALLVEEQHALDSLLADRGLKWHVEYQTYFADDFHLPNPIEEYPLMQGERYWVHTENTITGPNMGIGADHLWKWDGAEATLLQEAFSRRVY